LNTDELELERELASLLDVETFEAPAAFREHALLNDPAVYEEAEADWQGWWVKQAEQLDWARKWDTVLDDSNPPFYKWFVGGQLNVAHNCLDRHVAAGLGDRVALHWRGEEGEEREITYAGLLADVERFANALKDLGIGKGDVVGIYLPMIPEVVVSMLACARIGAPHNVVFGGFAPEAVRERMEFSDAKALITVDGASRKGNIAAVKHGVDAVMTDLPSLEHIIVVQSKGTDCEMKEGRDVWYHEIVERADEHCPAEPMDAEDPLYILYTSGSTAKPKGILHTTGGYLTGVSATHRLVFDLHPDEDVYWCAADVGWVTGHSYIVYGPLANGATCVMYEGAPDYPHRGIWWELIQRYGVTIFYTAPTAIRTCIKWGVKHPQGFDLSSLRLLGTVGEPINPKAWLWYHKVIGGERCPIVDTWWQTETGAIMITPLPGITATKPGSATTPFPGIKAEVVNDKGEPAGHEQGLLVLKRPWPSMLRTLYRDDERFVETYFAKFGNETYFVGDAARKFDLYQRHKTLGVFVFALAVARLMVRAARRGPGWPDQMSRLHRAAAGGAHGALYALTFAATLTGYAMVSTSPIPLPVALPGGLSVPNLLAADYAASERWKFAHHLCVLALGLLSLAHAAAALWHRFGKRDEVMARMGFGGGAR